ncbi:hypothetical protein [Henriciella sp.]|nr:hypothetical protein [Henriciella sp.]
MKRRAAARVTGAWRVMSPARSAALSSAPIMASKLSLMNPSVIMGASMG